MVGLRRYQISNLIAKAGLDPGQWRQVTNDGEYMVIENRKTGSRREIYIGCRANKKTDFKPDPSKLLIEKLGRRT